MNQYNDNGQRYGYWQRNWSDSFGYKCFYENDKRIGYEEATVDDNVEIKKYYLR